MPYLYKHRRPPATWKDFHPRPLHPYLLPFSYTNWAGEWMAYILGKWSIFEVLDYVGSFSILIAVIFYFADSGDRLKQKHYQAWQVINTAQGKGGSGGRIDALQELNNDGVSLAAVDLTDAQLEDLALVGADLRRADFSGADMKNTILKRASLVDSTLHYTNLRNGDFTAADLSRADLKNGDLNGANLGDAIVNKTDFSGVDLRNANLNDLRDWQAIESIAGADLHGIRNAPDGFVSWAIARGAIDEADMKRPATQPNSQTSAQPGSQTSAPPTATTAP